MKRSTDQLARLQPASFCTQNQPSRDGDPPPTKMNTASTDSFAHSKT